MKVNANMHYELSFTVNMIDVTQLSEKVNKISVGAEGFKVRQSISCSINILTHLLK